MKHIKNYKLFLENFEINDTDTVDVRMSKEKLNTITKQISDYKSKKSSIDNIFNKEGVDIKKELENLLGKTDTQNGPDRNPFLVEYVHLARVKHNVEKMRKQNVDDKIKLDDFQEELRLSTEQSTKQAVNDKIKNINKRMSDRTKKIADDLRDLNQKEVEHKERMSKVEKDMKEYITKISNAS